jgi:hypothetical protein
MLSRLRYNLVNVIVPFQIVRNAQTKDFSTVEHFQDLSIYYKGSNIALGLQNPIRNYLHLVSLSLNWFSEICVVRSSIRV